MLVAMSPAASGAGPAAITGELRRMRAELSVIGKLGEWNNSLSQRG
jgi:hypothetical protein